MVNAKLVKTIIPEIADLPELPLNYLQCVNQRIWAKYGKCEDISLEYILNSNLLNKDICLDIDCQKAVEELRTFIDFTIDNVRNCLIKYTDIGAFKEQFNARQSAKKYIFDHFDELLQTALSIIPENYVEQHQKEEARRKRRAERKAKKQKRVII